MDESVVRRFERQQVGTLKLSAAIRAGVSLAPQGVKWTSDSACTLCRAAMAAGWVEGSGEPSFGFAYRTWPELRHRSPKAPVYGTQGFDLSTTIEALNGFEAVRWPSERIADWLESEGL